LRFSKGGDFARCGKVVLELRRLVIRHAANQPLPTADLCGIGESGRFNPRDDVSGRVLLELRVRM
jgi:hypothetical protein